MTKKNLYKNVFSNPFRADKVFIFNLPKFFLQILYYVSVPYSLYKRIWPSVSIADLKAWLKTNTWPSRLKGRNPSIQKSFH
jgi:hypothetical protein